MATPPGCEVADQRRRVPCPSCGALIVEGALKCRACHRWLATPRPRPRPSRYSRSLTLIIAVVLAVGAVLISQRHSPVGEAPPLTPLTAGSSAVSAAVGGEPAPPQFAPEELEVNDGRSGGGRSEKASWRSRQLNMDVRPLDLVFHPSGRSIYVSVDDATVREYDVETTKLLHMVNVPALGDRIRLLHSRYIAVIRKVDAVRVPLVDTDSWEADPALLEVGKNPVDMIELPDGKTAVAASSAGKLLSWFDLADAKRLADIKLPHASHHLFLLRGDGRHYVGAMGQLYRADQPAGAWIDLFDPSETPFGATRRSISVGQEPRVGAVTGDLSSIFYADHASNMAFLLRLDGETTQSRSVTVGQEPEEAFILHKDRYGLTISAKEKTVTIVDLTSFERVSTLMLEGTPRTGAVAPDGKILVVSLGGTSWPPDGSGAAVISGDPPKLVATLRTGRGASRVAVAPDGTRAAVGNYWSKSLTIIER